MKYLTCRTLLLRLQKTVVSSMNRTQTFGFLDRRSSHLAIKATEIGGEFILFQVHEIFSRRLNACHIWLALFQFYFRTILRNTNIIHCYWDKEKSLLRATIAFGGHLKISMSHVIVILVYVIELNNESIAIIVIWLVEQDWIYVFYLIQYTKMTIIYNNSPSVFRPLINFVTYFATICLIFVDLALLFRYELRAIHKSLKWSYLNFMLARQVPWTVV